MEKEAVPTATMLSGLGVAIFRFGKDWNVEVKFFPTILGNKQGFIGIHYQYSNIKIKGKLKGHSFILITFSLITKSKDQYYCGKHKAF